MRRHPIRHAKHQIRHAALMFFAVPVIICGPFIAIYALITWFIHLF